MRVFDPIAGAFALILLLVAADASEAQDQQRQSAIETFVFDNPSPAYSKNSGPKVLIHRFMSPYLRRGSYEPFKALVETDGFEVDWLDRRISSEALASVDIYAVVNAYSRSGDTDYRKYPPLGSPSVFSAEEMELIVDWVQKGGSLLLIADHSAFASGTMQLAAKFGFTFMTGHAISKNSTGINKQVHIDFRREPKDFYHGKLANHQITDGSLGREVVDHFYAFGGQAIIPPPEAMTLLRIPENYDTILTYRLDEDFRTAPRVDASGFSQGAVLEFGNGRVAVFGEAGGFTAQQIDDVYQFGLLNEKADQNAEFVLATMRWLGRFDQVSSDLQNMDLRQSTDTLEN
jgi:hypothetical protein